MLLSPLHVNTTESASCHLIRDSNCLPGRSRAKRPPPLPKAFTIATPSLAVVEGGRRAKFHGGRGEDVCCLTLAPPTCPSNPTPYSRHLLSGQRVLILRSSLPMQRPDVCSLCLYPLDTSFLVNKIHSLSKKKKKNTSNYMFHQNLPFKEGVRVMSTVQINAGLLCVLEKRNPINRATEMASTRRMELD